MTLDLTWGLATFRMLGTVSTLQRDRVWKSLTRRHGRVAVGSDGVGRRVALDDGILFVCLFVLAGLVVLGSVLMLLSWTTATLPPSMLRSCPEFDLCGAASPHDGNESLSVDDPLTDGLRMTP
jgi:hypothetical protein